MVQLKPGRAAIAGLLVGTGAVLSSLGFLRPGAVTLGPGTMGTLLVPTIGVACLLLGFLLFARAIVTSRDVAPSIPAHVAFTRKVNPPIDLPSPVRSTPTPRRSTNAPPLGKSAQRPTSDHAEDQIRELTRKINRAGVMLATGKLSSEGYAKYVEDLKRQRAVLEAARVYRDLDPAKS